MVIRPLENFLRDQEVHRLQTFEVKNGLFLQEISTQKMDFGVKKSDFQNRSKIHSKHVRLSENMFWGPESRLGPLGNIYNALEVILEKKYVAKWKIK